MCVNHITSPLKFSINLILMWFFTQWTLELWKVFLNNAAGSEFYIGSRADWTGIWKREEESI